MRKTLDDEFLLFWLNRTKSLRLQWVITGELHPNKFDRFEYASIILTRPTELLCWQISTRCPCIHQQHNHI